MTHFFSIVLDVCKGNPCHANATCTTYEDSFTCSCNSNLLGDGIVNCTEGNIKLFYMKTT